MKQHSFSAPLALGDGSVAEDVEADLYRLNVRKLDGLERFLDLLHAHAIVPELSCLHEVVENSKHFRAIIEPP